MPESGKYQTDLARLRAELDALRHRESLLDATEQVASIGHCEWDYENDRILSCSDGYARIFNMSIEDVLERHSDWKNVIEQIHPDDRERYLRSYRSQRKSGSHEIEYRIIRNDGEIRHLCESGVVVFNKDGSVKEAFGLIQDVTQRRSHERDLENRDALAQQVEALTDIGHFIFNLKSESYDYISPGFARIHGVSIETYLRSVRSIEDDISDVHPEDYQRVAAIYRKHGEDGEPYHVEYRIHRADGAERWIREQCTALRAESGEIEQSIGVLQDITRQKNIERSLRNARDSMEVIVEQRTQELADTVKRLEKEIVEREKIAAELDFLANHDALTGLPSLRLCKDRLNQSLAEARRNRQLSAVMFLDLDGFKPINDSYGHEFGDLVLKAIADRITGEIRETDTVARIGGDEFVIILTSVPGVAVVERIAKNLIRQIIRPIQIEKAEVSVSASIGIALYPKNGTTTEELIRAADKAMYGVKNRGKNNFGFIETELVS